MNWTKVSGSTSAPAELSQNLDAGFQSYLVVVLKAQACLTDWGNPLMKAVQANIEYWYKSHQTIFLFAN